MPHPGLVVALVYDGLCLFEFGIAVELFGLARPELEISWYDFKVAGVESRPCAGLGGVSIAARGGLALLQQAQTIVIPGWNSANVPSPRLLRALRRAHARGARLMSICSGAFLLGHAGLLDGRRATTHWRYTQAFHAQFPEVELVPDVLYVDEGQIITSAGSAAGIDAGLHLIRRDFGAAVANQVARRLVVTPHRDGGQKQFIPSPVNARENTKFDLVIAWALARLDQPLTLGALASKAAMSERHFLRRFAQTTGTTPKAWLQRARIGRAQELIEVSDAPLDRVAEQCGFASLETFRVAFRRQVGLAPGSYRRRFREASK